MPKKVAKWPRVYFMPILQSTFYFGYAKITCTVMRGRTKTARYCSFCFCFGRRINQAMNEPRKNKLERDFQPDLIKQLKQLFENCIVMKLDSSYIQGIPDLLVLFKDKWAILECKRGPQSHRQPNQEYYVDLLNRMSFSSFIYPENKEHVLNELKKFLGR